MPRRTTRRRSRSSTTSTARPPGRLRRCTSTGCRPVGSGRVTWTWLRDAEVPVRDDRIRPPRRVRLHQLAEPGADHAGREVFAGGGGDGDAAAHGGAGAQGQGQAGELSEVERLTLVRSDAAAACQAHNLEVVGSSPTSATNRDRADRVMVAPVPWEHVIAGSNPASPTK